MNKVFTTVLLTILFCFTHAVNIPTCTNGGVSFLFMDTDGKVDVSTRATICHDNKNLHVEWQNIDEQVISTYKNCNDPLYKEDVVEIFIASTKSYPTNYWEI